jgi:hypothetical protein
MLAVTWAILLLGTSEKAHMRYGERPVNLTISAASQHRPFITDTNYHLDTAPEETLEMAAAPSWENNQKSISEGDSFRTVRQYSTCSPYFCVDGDSYSKINLLLIFPFHFFW